MLAALRSYWQDEPLATSDRLGTTDLPEQGYLTGRLFSSSRISVSKTSVALGAEAGGTDFFSMALNPFTIMKRIKAIITNLMIAAKKLPYFTAPQANLSISCKLAALRAGVNNKGVMI